MDNPVDQLVLLSCSVKVVVGLVEGAELMLPVTQRAFRWWDTSVLVPSTYLDHERRFVLVVTPLHPRTLSRMHSLPRWMEQPSSAAVQSDWEMGMKNYSREIVFHAATAVCTALTMTLMQ